MQQEDEEDDDHSDGQASKNLRESAHGVVPFASACKADSGWKLITVYAVHQSFRAVDHVDPALHFGNERHGWDAAVTCEHARMPFGPDIGYLVQRHIAQADHRHRLAEKIFGG